MPWNPLLPGSTSQQDNQEAAVGLLTLVTSAARTTNGNSAGFDIGGVESLGVEVNVTAVSGTTPSLAITVQWSNDNVNWADADVPDAFTARTATGRVFRHVTTKARYARVVWAITGTTPSFTFNVNAVAMS